MANNGRAWSLPQIIWSALIAVVVWSAVGFSWFGHGFNWMTHGAAAQLTTKAVTETLATICVAQAHNGPDATAALTEFADVDTWKQREYIEKAKWSTMPGSESTQNGVTELCVIKLRKT